MYPSLEVDLSKIRHNTITLMKLCKSYNIEILGVTKVFGGEPTIAGELIKAGLKKLGDSRVENIKRYAHLSCEKWLIRMPAEDEIRRVVKYCDGSVNSESGTLKLLQKEALMQNKIHKVLLMVDLGDLREGFLEEDHLVDSIRYVNDCSHLQLSGLGTNLTCLSFVQPDEQKLSYLANLAKEHNAGSHLSGGNSATIHLMLQDNIPEEINSLRLGESLLFGRERAEYQYINNMHNDAFCVEAKIIECKEKPSMPYGTIGKDSYGRKPVFKDQGIRKRIICALGKQDIDAETMWPLDQNNRIVGASSDHLIVDVTDSTKNYKLGDTIKFRLGYFATMRAFTSHYVEKNIS